MFTKLYKSIIEGFISFKTAFYFWKSGDSFDFWQEINYGWYNEYIYPYDDWYTNKVSNERKTRLAQHNYLSMCQQIIISDEAFVELLELLDADQNDTE